MLEEIYKGFKLEHYISGLSKERREKSLGIVRIYSVGGIYFTYCKVVAASGIDVAFNRARRIVDRLLNRNKNAPVSDTTSVDSSNADGNQKTTGE